jgi:hypothetical protein
VRRHLPGVPARGQLTSRAGERFLCARALFERLRRSILQRLAESGLVPFVRADDVQSRVPWRCATCGPLYRR